MEITATQKFIRVSPRKLRPVVALIKKMSPVKAVEVLPYVGKRAAGPLVKVVKTAIANAVQMGFANSELVFKEIQIGEGPTLKRGNPVSRGRFHAIKKRMSHIRIVLIAPEKKSKSEEVKKEGKEKNGTKN
jgi:large subunit ribosomal protein L22